MRKSIVRACAVLLGAGLNASMASAMPPISGRYVSHPQFSRMGCDLYPCWHPNDVWALPSHGYTYGPDLNLGSVSAPLIRRPFGDALDSFRYLGCPLLCVGDYWRQTAWRRRTIEVGKTRILIRQR
jgi:hypothetical protein